MEAESVAERVPRVRVESALPAIADIIGLPGLSPAFDSTWTEHSRRARAVPTARRVTIAIPRLLDAHAAAR